MKMSKMSLSNNVRERDTKIPGSEPRSATTFYRFLTDPPDPSTKSHGNSSSSFCVILLTIQPTNIQSKVYKPNRPNHYNTNQTIQINQYKPYHTQLKYTNQPSQINQAVQTNQTIPTAWVEITLSAVF